MSQHSMSSPLRTRPVASQRSKALPLLTVAALLGLLAAFLTAGSVATAAVGQPTLRFGSTGPCVAHVERQLHIPDDGVFGPVTYRAVVGFQRRHGLVPDGIVGPRTWSKLPPCQRSAPGQRPAPRTEPAPRTKPAPAARSTNAHAEVLRLTNVHRARNGCPALTADARLNKAAQAHSNWQAANRRMSHTGSGGSKMEHRVSAAGYRWSMLAENVAWGYRTPSQVVTGWMNSTEGHRENILDCRFKHLGVGIGSNNGVLYWTQVFGRSG